MTVMITDLPNTFIVYESINKINEQIDYVFVSWWKYCSFCLRNRYIHYGYWGLSLKHYLLAIISADAWLDLVKLIIKDTLKRIYTKQIYLLFQLFFYLVCVTLPVSFRLKLRRAFAIALINYTLVSVMSAFLVDFLKRILSFLIHARVPNMFMFVSNMPRNRCPLSDNATNKIWLVDYLAFAKRYVTYGRQHNY